MPQQSHPLSDDAIAKSRAVGVIGGEPAWIIIHAPLIEAEGEEPKHLSDIYGYQFRGLDDGPDGYEFLVALLRSVADQIEEDNGYSQEDPAPDADYTGEEWRDPTDHFDDPTGEEPPTP